jgi:hypothetical protein
MQHLNRFTTSRRQAITLGVAIALPLLAHKAAGQTGVALPPELGSELPGAALAGSTRMRFFGLNIYDARLWVTPGFQPATYWQHAFALELVYLRSLGGQAIAQRSLDEMRRSGPLNTEVADRWLATMRKLFPDVAAGDRITGLHSPGQGARFWVNSQPRPAVNDLEFSRAFFGIWLAESTSEPRLRTELLSGIKP